MNTVVVAVTGPSSSGKSTLSRLLRQVFDNSTIIYQDDFYLTDKDIPVAANGLQDWDCPEAFDLEYMHKVLKHIRQHGTAPKDFHSKEETNSLGPSHVDDEQVHRIKEAIPKSLQEARVVIVDGILLLNKDSPLVDDFDVKLFLRASYSVLKERRENRTGYVTLEDFWEDPPGYFDDIVWPGYVKAHSYLFEHGNVEGQLDQPAIDRGIKLVPAKSMVSILDWAVTQIKQTASAIHE
uniref:ARAD1C16170p n=1 Tax=Blastobotrys adeninivorans TaxID=409370 RepID=A0A060T5Z5_BLAAD